MGHIRTYEQEEWDFLFSRIAFFSGEAENGCCWKEKLIVTKWVGSEPDEGILFCGKKTRSFCYIVTRDIWARSLQESSWIFILFRRRKLPKDSFQRGIGNLIRRISNSRYVIIHNHPRGGCINIYLREARARRRCRRGVTNTSLTGTSIYYLYSCQPTLFILYEKGIFLFLVNDIIIFLESDTGNTKTFQNIEWFRI